MPCDIEPAFSLHEYAVDYCETHDQPADQCRPDTATARIAALEGALTALADYAADSTMESPGTRPHLEVLVQKARAYAATEGPDRSTTLAGEADAEWPMPSPGTDAVLDVETLRLVFHDEYDRGEGYGCRHQNQHRKSWDCQHRVNEVMEAARLATLDKGQPDGP